MKQLHDRRAIRLHMSVGALLEMLEREGYLDKDHDHAHEDAIPGPTLLPSDGKVIGVYVGPLGHFLDVEVESDSFGDGLKLQGGQAKRVAVNLQ